ncbi:MAG: Rib/alpha-like domain-containing protein [Lactobacillus kalixensis]|uniref:Rib/alpha-like domain-containing protein n=1 Tax=Lactobacillus kalixensis TaxID=227944 RepID=UPI0039948B57
MQYNAAIFIDSTDNGGNVIIDNGANLTINGETSNAMGIFFDGSASQGTIDSVRTGLIKVGQNATLKIDLKDGNSAAIYADDIDVLDGGTVDITTAQNTTSNGTGTMNGGAAASTGGLGGIHNGVINLGMHGINLNPTLRIGKNTTFKVNRTSDKSSSALLSFNTVGLGGGMTSSLLVNGGSLDLQDHANNYGYFFQNGNGPYGNLPHVGLITMWGTSSKSIIDFEAPKYVNFERFGKAVGVNGDETDGKTGAFLCLESNNVEVDINKSATNVVTPLQQWDENSTTPYKWYIVKEHNTNQWGNNASGFVKQGTNVSTVFVGQGVAKFGESNGSATVAESAASDANKTEYNNAALTDAPDYMESFLNNFNWWSPQHMTFGSDLIISGQYTPSYKPVNVEQGQTATDDPSFTDQDGKDTTAPTGTTFTTGTDTPDWATIDPSTGTITVKPGTDVTPGAYNVPVTVTYPDKSADETTVPVIVTAPGQTVTWGDNGAIVTTVDTSKLNAHETTENSQVLSPAGVVTAQGYELTDGKLSTTATPITIDSSTISWTTTPDTNVDTATAAGKEITTSVNVDFTNNDIAKNILGSKNGTVTTNPFTIDAKGAGAKTVITPVNVDLGSDLTNEQFSQLVDNNIPTDKIASTTWATKPDANGQGGVIKITFTDKDANGNPTYLNVNIPASSIKVTTDADKNTPEGQDVNTKTGVVPDPAEGIKNKSDLPDGTKYTWKDTPDVTTAGDKPATVVVSYPDGSKDEVPVTIHVTNPATDADKYTPEGQDVNTKTSVVPDPAEGIKNKSDLPDGTKYTWKDTPDVTTAGNNPAVIVVTYPDGSKDEVPVTIHVTNPATPTDADKYTPEGQDVNTKTGVVPDPAEGIKNKGDLPDGTKYTWKDTPDVSTEGNKPAVIVVTYPDGSKDEVPVTIHVTNPDNGGNNTNPGDNTPTNPSDKTPTNNNDNNVPSNNNGNSGNDENTGKPNTGKSNHSSNSGTHGENLNGNNGSGVTNTVYNSDINSNNIIGANNNSHVSKKTMLPQTGESDSKASIFGLAFAGLAMLLGFTDRKKRKGNK